jgi:hypothetical protein
MCKICGVAHWLRDGHSFGGKARARAVRSPTIAEIKDATAALERAFPSPKSVAPPKLPAARNALAEVEARTAKPKPKRKSTMVAKDGTNRGRPKGPNPFDKKAHDRKKSAERRAKMKAAAAPATKP